MSKRISACDAKNNFGGLLEDVAALGRAEIMKHGRLVAVVLSPRVLEGAPAGDRRDAASSNKHMIPPERARAARLLRRPSEFDAE
jgi:prevent-host-death family protein